MNVCRSKWNIFVNEEQDKMLLRFKIHIFLKELTKIYNEFTVLPCPMKHDVTASIKVYLCFKNNIKHYPSYIKCMFIITMFEGCAFVLFVLSL